MKILTIKNDVFAYDVNFILSDDKKEVSEYLIKKWLDDELLDMSQWYTYITDSVAYLYLTDRSDYVLLHECIHIIQWLLARKWIDTSYNNTEVLAYNTDWLYRNLLLAYYKYKKNDKYKNYLWR